LRELDVELLVHLVILREAVEEVVVVVEAEEVVVVVVVEVEGSSLKDERTEPSPG
jgi:hypothetical protein